MKNKLNKIRKSVLKNIKKIFFNNFIFYFLLTTTLVLFFLYNYVFNAFSNFTLEQIIYGLKTAGGTSSDIIIDGAIYVGIRVALFYIIFLIVKFIFNKIVKNKTYLILNVRNKKVKFTLFPISKRKKIIIAILVLTSFIVYIFNEPFINDYISTRKKSDFFDKYYMDPNNVEVTAPKKKQNIIYIYVESLETSMVSLKNGGAFTETIIPNLEKIALDKDNIHFSNTNVLGGAYMPYGANWTIAALVGSSSGTPLKIPISGDEYWTSYGKFLPGVVSLGDILEKNGYKNYFMLGSDANFGGRNNYFNTHGNYKIYDYYYAKENGWIETDYKEWWGYEDKKLFEYAKDTLTDVSKNDEPFNFTLLTADTHFTDGYYEESCENPFNERYLNSYHCSDSMVGDFVKWIKKQDFYENTTIVIVGDHLTMQANITSMFEIDNPKEYERTIYNVFINSKTNINNTTRNREFNTFDLYPTTLASLGFTIEGERLGLGTNLFSAKPTLVEVLGNNKVNNEIKLTSDYYYNNLLGTESDNKMVAKEEE